MFTAQNYQPASNLTRFTLLGCLFLAGFIENKCGGILVQRISRPPADMGSVSLDASVGVDGYLRLDQVTTEDSGEFYLNFTRASISLTDVTTLKKVEEWPNNNNLFVDVTAQEGVSGLIQIKAR